MLTRKQLEPLTNSDNLRRRQIAAALLRLNSMELESSESAWVDRIEAKRQELIASSERIKIIDHGTGVQKLGSASTCADGGLELWRTVGEQCRTTSKSQKWALLLFFLIRETKPNSCVELGTSVGISALYQAAALQLNLDGHLITLEGAPAVAGLAERTIAEMNLDNVQVECGRFQNTLPRILPRVKPVDYAFIDGHHEETATINYFEQMIPYLSTDSVLVFDDIHWSDGMTRAWKRVSQSSQVSTAIDLGEFGLCIVNGEASPRIMLQRRGLAFRQSVIGVALRRVRSSVRSVSRS